MKKQILSLMFAGCLFGGCEDIFETDISGKAVSVQAPQYGAWVSPGEATFVWYELKGADEYRLIVVSPDFETPSRTVMDTVVREIYFGMTLEEGDYGWSIQGRNFGYNSIRQSYVLHVGTPPEKPDTPGEPESLRDPDEFGNAEESGEGSGNERTNE